MINMRLFLYFRIRSAMIFFRCLPWGNISRVLGEFSVLGGAGGGRGMNPHDSSLLNILSPHLVQSFILITCDTSSSPDILQVIKSYYARKHGETSHQDTGLAPNIQERAKFLTTGRSGGPQSGAGSIILVIFFFLIIAQARCELARPRKMIFIERRIISRSISEIIFIEHMAQ